MHTAGRRASAPGAKAGKAGGKAFKAPAVAAKTVEPHEGWYDGCFHFGGYGNVMSCKDGQDVHYLTEGMFPKLFAALKQPEVRRPEVMRDGDFAVLTVIGGNLIVEVRFFGADLPFPNKSTMQAELGVTAWLPGKKDTPLVESRRKLGSIKRYSSGHTYAYYPAGDWANGGPWLPRVAEVDALVAAELANAYAEAGLVAAATAEAVAAAAVAATAAAPATS